MRLTLLKLVCVCSLIYSDIVGGIKNKQWTQISFIVVQAEFVLPVKTAERAAGLHSVYVQISSFVSDVQVFFVVFFNPGN